MSITQHHHLSNLLLTITNMAFHHLVLANLTILASLVSYLSFSSLRPSSPNILIRALIQLLLYGNRSDATL